MDAGNKWQVSKDAKDYNRRSLYIFTRRSVPYPMLESFDMASPQEVHSKRDVTTTPLQALTLYNDQLTFEWSQDLAGRLIREAGSDESARLNRLYQILFARNPSQQEQDTLFAYLDNHEKIVQAQVAKKDLPLPRGVDVAAVSNPSRESAFVDLVHTILNSNDFAYRF